MAYKGLAGRCGAAIGRREPCRQIGHKQHIGGLLVYVLPLAGEDHSGRWVRQWQMASVGGGSPVLECCRGR